MSVDAHQRVKRGSWSIAYWRGESRQECRSADAFAAALAIAHGATLLTADPEFEALGDRIERVAV